MKSIEQLCIKAKVQKSPEQIESAFMDLIESIVRHLSVIAIAAYRNSGCKNNKINKSILAQILMPSFGSWKNILEMLTTLDQTYFPDKFYDNFLMPLNKKLKNDIVAKAYTRINQLLEWATTEKDNFSFSQTNQSCNSKQFFQKMVEYRNRFGGHGTRGMPENLKISVEIIREGIIELSKLLRKNWINYPIYLAKKGELAGEEFIKLYSLIGNNNEKIEISEKKIKENQLIVCMNKQKSMFETLFPLAIWHDEDVMFFNGNKNFKRLLYIGYNSIESVFGTDKFEMQFIDYYLSFHALKLMPLDLLNEDNWNKAIELIKDNWVFPKLKKEMPLRYFKWVGGNSTYP